jgi:hypothetical protein
MGPTRRSYPSVYARQRDMAAAEEAETSKRPRRPRGRPRREPLTDHGCSSSRDSVHDDNLQHMVDGDGGPWTDDEEAATAGGSTSSGMLKPYQRGTTKLPKQPIPIERHPLIAPEGDK